MAHRGVRHGPEAQAERDRQAQAGWMIEGVWAQDLEVPVTANDVARMQQWLARQLAPWTAARMTAGTAAALRDGSSNRPARLLRVSVKVASGLPASQLPGNQHE